MTGGDSIRVADAGRQENSALAAAGIVGTWEYDHRRQTMRYSPEAAALLAGDADLAHADLNPVQALAGVYTDDVAWLRTQMCRAASAPGVYIREYQVRSEGHGIGRVLCRGRTYFDADAKPTVTLGIVLDITEIEADGRSRHTNGEGKLDAAAQYSVAAYEAVEATGIKALVTPARALLMAIGREIARGLTSVRRPLH